MKASNRRMLLVVFITVVMAYISAKYLFNASTWNVVPWGILAFATAFIASSKHEAWKLGGIFGFGVSYAFLWFDNTSPMNVSKVVFLAVLVVIPALFGLLFGSLLAALGWCIRRLRQGDMGNI